MDRQLQGQKRIEYKNMRKRQEDSEKKSWCGFSVLVCGGTTKLNQKLSLHNE